MAINKEIITKDFLELSAIDSLSLGERKMADRLKARLEEMGFTVSEDDAGAHYDGNAGNLYGFLKGSVPGKPIMFSAHMDTVAPGFGKKAIVDGDIITSDGTTVLGGDDLTGVIAILRGVETAIESGEPRRDIEVLFTIGEELYTKGANVFDYKMIKARDVYVLDMSGEPGRLALKAPSIVQFTATITGKAAHAGFEPERGIHAISIASKAIARMPKCKPDDISTFNIGTIEGGIATNIVPETCVITGEVRSFVHENAMKWINEAEAIFQAETDEGDGKLDFDVFVAVEAFETSKDADVVKRYEKVCKSVGVNPVLTKTFGGSDNNRYSKEGLSGVVMSTGMGNVHSTKEFCTISHMTKNAEIVEKLVRSMD